MALLPCADAEYDSSSRDGSSCLNGTREGILQSIFNWINDNDPNGPRIFWINGLAGMGKSTIAHTIAEHVASRGAKLRASFFFSRDVQDRRNPLLLFSTIAYQLAKFDFAFRSRLAEV